MATPRLRVDPDQCKAAYAAAVSKSDFCRRLGVAYNATALERICSEIGLTWPAEHWGRKLEADATPAPPPDVVVEQDRTELRLRQELQEIRRKYDVACKTGNLHEDILSICREVMGRAVPVKIESPHIGTGRTVETAVLGWADWHGGEVIDYDVMQGYNAYNPSITCRRAQYTVDHTLSILYDTQQGTTFDRLVVLSLGDKINGDHLPEQMATNALPVFESMLFVARLEAQALTELSAHLPVVYVSVPGNHGRRGQKVQWKLPSETADWLIGQMVSHMVAGNDRIECFVPKAWTAGITIRGQHHSLNHGMSAAQGGYGGIPWYSYMRADGQKGATESAHGKRVNHRWYGHIHQRAEIPMMDGEGEQHIVGSLKGGDEYALEGLNRYSDPVQKLVGCHDEYGVTWRYPLNVKRGDGNPSRYESLL